MDILHYKWNKIDKELEKYYITFKRANKSKKEDIQASLKLLNVTRDNLYSYAESNVISSTRRLKLDNEYYMYKYNKILGKKRAKNNEILELLMLYCHLKEDTKEQEQLFTNTITIAKDIALEETKEEKKPFKFTNQFIKMILLLPNVNGYVWSDYLNEINVYNANEMVRNIIIKLNKDIGKKIKGKIETEKQNIRDIDIDKEPFKSMLKRQQKRMLNYNPNTKRYSGAIETEVTSIYSNTQARIYEKRGVEKVIFTATIDKVTTNMCKSLNNQVFNVKGINEYYRYSKQAGGNVLFRTEGLKLGENLPPITDNFHYCRSAIAPYRR